MQRIELKKGNGPLGFSVVGGSDHACHPFGVDEPGLFISKVSVGWFFDRGGGGRILQLFSGPQCLITESLYIRMQ